MYPLLNVDIIINWPISYIFISLRVIFTGINYACDLSSIASTSPRIYYENCTDLTIVLGHGNELLTQSGYVD